MESVRLDAIYARCILCGHAHADGHRVVPAYRASSFLYARQEIELGLFVGDIRPMWRHVDCEDPKLSRYQLRPDISYCIRCRKHVEADDCIHPVMQIIDPRATNPTDPTDNGVTLGDRIHFVHVDCMNPRLGGGASPLLFVP